MVEMVEQLLLQIPRYTEVVNIKDWAPVSHLPRQAFGICIFTCLTFPSYTYPDVPIIDSPSFMLLERRSTLN
ncbi:unnamed protein product [Tuber melanosporum]|uniref:(Perigord truffle) hypothetical protein n=1 Tax=Tuber melanosporum (strain Mel28) TaxID=656061 RepID=D5GG84_TUBMM|nr:uncharacterized protein GSTUM_00001998001 [Tuber melanosporum]CAZ83527.1 unnamed protein product [Tuber melanosporum]